ncbi:MAG TPA: YeeE/YedE family protein [Burkholderiaceae bacterium]|nr:YeeE/YedE family protein [Burkholderiaceae bacterium]
MAVDWASFNPGPATIGGALIGLASALLILGAGRVAGIAGIVGTALQGLVQGRRPGRDALRWAFIAGLAAAPWLWRLVAPLPAAQGVAATATLIAAGVLVGVGVRMGNGCTSGHGVCGLSRLSLRSLANVLAFMGAGFATVAVMRHLLGA